MGKGIEIGIASETKAYKQGMETGVIKPTENAIEALDELGKADGLDDLEESLEDAQTASKKLKRETEQAADAIEKDFRRAYREMKEASEEGTDEASEGFDTMEQKGIRGAQRIGGSFNDVGDILTGLQRTASQALSGFGPAGAVAGAVAAAGLGLATAEIEKQQKLVDELKEYFRNAYQAAAEEGRNFIDEAQVQAEVLNIIFGEDQTRHQQAVKDAQTLGLETSTIIRAQAGDQAALNEVIDRSNSLAQAYADSMAAANTPAEKRALLMQAERAELVEVNNRYNQQQGILDENAAKAAEYLQIQNDTTQAIKGRNAELRDTPSTLPVALQVDTSPLDRLQNSQYLANVRVQLQDQYGRRIV